MLEEFYDRYDDRLTVEDDGEYVALEAFEGGNRACVEFPAEDAKLVAGAILEAAGEKLVPLSDLKSAKDLSFNEGMARLAIIHKRTITFRYAKDDGKYIEARRLNPESISADGARVYGHDPDREGEPRAFRFDRMKGEVEFA